MEDKQRLAPHPVLKEYYDSEDVRRDAVDTMFNTAAPHYDWINSVMSFGSGVHYRRDVLRRMGLTTGKHMLDVGAGTGVLSVIAQEIVGEDGFVVALDPSEGMLAEAKKSGVKNTVVGMAENLPYEDNSFDFLTMGYALRHVNDLAVTFEEYLRALKPGGKVLLLEITRPPGRIAYFFAKLYLKHFIPLVTRIFRRSQEGQKLMSYYWDTIENCVPPEVIMDAMKAAGFENVKRDVVMGLFSEYSGIKSTEVEGKS